MICSMRIVALLFLFFVFNPSASYGEDAEAAAPLLWSASMEDGSLKEWDLDQCGGEYNSGVANAEASREHAHSGSWSARLTISATGSSPSGTRLFRWCEAQQYPALYYRVWFYFPQRYTVANWWDVFQWKSKISSTKNDPFFILNVGNRTDGTMYFYLYDWQQRISHSQAATNIPVGQWLQVEAFYQCAADKTGRVTVWQDGKLLFDVANVRTRYTNGDCEWSVNNYSDALSPADATLYIDDAAISATQGGVQAPILSPPSGLRVSDKDKKTMAR